MGLADSSAALNILVESQDRSGPGLEHAEGNVNKVSKGVDKAKLAWSALGAGAIVASGFLSEAAQAAADDAADTQKLKVAVENSGVAFSAVSERIDERIKKGQSLAFTDDQVRDSLSLLTAETGSVEEAFKRQTLAMDLARGMGVDLQTASKLLGKVTDDNIKVLGRYGIHIDKVAVSEKDHKAALKQVSDATLAHDKAVQHLAEVQQALHGRTKLNTAEQLKLREAQKGVQDSTQNLAAAQEKAKKTTEEGANQAALFAAVQQKFGGQAQAYGDSTSGAIAKIKDQIGEWKESVGAALGPAQGFIALLPGISTGMTLIGATLGPVAGGLIEVAKSARVAAIGAALLDIALGPIGLIMLGIAAVAALLALAWKNNWGDIQGKTKAVIAVVGPLISGFFSTLQTLWQTAGPIIQAAAQVILWPIFTVIDTVRTAISLLQTLGVLKKQQAGGGSGAHVDNFNTTGYGVRHAASGFEGVVDRPTLFLAGESGSERVSIVPRGSRSSAGGGVVFNIAINGNVDSKDRVQELGIEFERRRRLYGGRTRSN